MLQVTYMVQNSDWVLTNAARGNNDIELCAVAQHQDATRNNGARCGQVRREVRTVDVGFETKTYSGVLTTVSNASKVKTDPADLRPRQLCRCFRGYLADVDGLHPVRLGLEDGLGRQP